jgi:predicted nucleotidyltransferase
MPSPQLELHGIAIPMEQLAQLCRRYHVRELALFGSVLRDDFRPDSDVDVLVEFEPGAPVGLFEFFDLQDALVEFFGRQVDLVPKRGLKRLIRQHVLDTSRTLYAA